MLARLGSSELTGRDVVQAVYPDLERVSGKQVDPNARVVGLEPGQSFDRAPCCQSTAGRTDCRDHLSWQGVIVHAIDCARLSEYEDQPDRWLDLHWHDGNHPAIIRAVLDLTIGNGAGVLGRICTLIGEAYANISDLKFLDRKPDFYRLLIYVAFRDVRICIP